MKIGILTHYYRSANYGGNLQAYALCKVLEEMGHQPQQVQIDHSADYQNLLSPQARGFKHKLKQLAKPVVRLLLPKYRKKWQQEEAARQQLQERFSHFNRELIPHSQTVYTPNTIRRAIFDYDAFITGSDQVWNPIWYFPPFFLDFVPSVMPKLSYAASIGQSQLPAAILQRYRAHLKDFIGVSVREEDAVTLLGCNAQWVLDPTMLLTKAQWLEVAEPSTIETPYVFCYFLGNDLEMRNAAAAYAKAKGLTLVTIPNATGLRHSNDENFGDLRLPDPSPEAFLGLIEKAEFVFTDSFHATVFSLIFGRTFATFPREGHGSSRITTLLQLFDAQSHFSPDSPAQLSPVCYDAPAFHQALQHSRDYLQTTLEKAKEMLP